MENLETKPVENDDEISLIDLMAVLLKYKRMIIATVVFGMIAAVTISVISIKLPPEKSFLPNKYTSAGHMIINDSKSAGGALSSMLSSSGLGSLASFAGINASVGSSYSSLAIYLVSSNPFLDAIAEEFKFMDDPAVQNSKYPVSDTRELIKKAFTAGTDTDSGVFTISFTDIDPVKSKEVTDYAITWLSDKFDQLGIDKNKISKINLEKNIDLSFKEISRLQEEANRISNSVNRWNGNVPSIALESAKIQMELKAQEEVYKQLKTQYELLKVQMQSESPVFQILERPEVPEMKSGPSRGKLCIIITFASGFFAVFLAFLLNALHNIKHDESAMAKLRATKKQNK